MAWHSEIVDERTAHDVQQKAYITRDSFQEVTTTRDKVAEVFSLLRHDVLISDGGHKKLEKRLKKRESRDLVLSQVSSYIDQAENFYNYARNSDYRSAALLYYYSFLNMAKAAIIMNKPSLLNKKFGHGVQVTKSSGQLGNRKIKIKETDEKNVAVYNELYKLIFGEYLPKDYEIKTLDFLGYITDITLEVGKVTNSPTGKVHRCKYYLNANKDSGDAWITLITTRGLYPANYPKAYKNFVKNFERFKPTAFSYQLTYEMKSSGPDSFANFNHSKKLFKIDELGRYPMREINKYLISTFGKNVETDLLDGADYFLVNDPLDDKQKISFNETMAIYSFMFYLSSVVRYDPNEFDTNFSPTTTDGWVVKNFVESATFVALSHLASHISGKVYGFKYR